MRTQRGLAQCQYTSGHRPFYCDTKKMDETGQHNVEEDPAASFLAREQDDLAGLVDDTLEFSEGGILAPTGEGLINTGDDLFGIPSVEEPPISNDPYSAILQMDETPACIRQWKEEQEQLLAEKDAAETEALKELKVTAVKELQDWYNHYEDQLKHIKESNRQAEEAFIEERDNTIPGHEWEKVARMCDFNPKNNKNTKDVSRMRSMFLQLKQTPPVR